MVPNFPSECEHGLAFLHMKDDPERALSAFRDGLKSDPTNIAVYLGIDQALSLLNRPASERVEALEKYPQLDAAPPDLIFELILNLAEAGDFERATKLFHDRFFPREEGGTNVRQVWIEVQLQRVMALAEQGHCSEAFSLGQRLGAEVPGLVFTRDGLEPILQSPEPAICSARPTQAAENPTKPSPNLSLQRKHLLPTRSDGLFWPLESCPGSTRRNGKTACNPLWNRRPIAARPAGTQVGGCIRQARLPKNWARRKKLIPGFKKLLCCPIACWHITSHVWLSRKLRNNHFNLRFSQGFPEFSGCPAIRDQPVHARNRADTGDASSA